MKDIHNKLTCLFGYHQYSKKPTKDKDGYDVYLCKICKRSGRIRLTGFDILVDYDEKGNRTHQAWKLRLE